MIDGRVGAKSRSPTVETRLAPFTADVEFSAEDATRTDPDFLEQISKAVVAAGARTVNLPDTVGYSVPEEYGALIGRMARALGRWTNFRDRRRLWLFIR